MKRINWFPILMFMAIVSAIAIIWFLQTVSRDRPISVREEFVEILSPETFLKNEDNSEIEWPDPKTINVEFVESLPVEVRKQISESSVPVLLPEEPSQISGFSLTNTGYLGQFSTNESQGYLSGQLTDHGTDQLNREKPNIYRTETGWSATWYEQDNIVYLVHLSCGNDCSDAFQILDVIKSLKFAGGKGN